MNEFIKKYQKVEVKEYPNKVKPEPLVSVCIMTYNHVNYIKDCLDGILMQITNFDFEILLGEDNSYDGTREICVEYAQKYPDKIRLFLHHRENNIKINGSPTGRFNFLYNLYSAGGKYIALCEGDDYWTDPYKLQKQVNFLEGNEEYGMCAHDVKTIYEDDWKAEKTNRFNKPIDNATFVDLIDNHFIPTNSLIFRNHLIKKWPEWLSSPNIISGDIPLELMLAFHGKLKYFFDEMAVKRINEGGVTADKSRKLKYKHFKFEMYCNLNHYTKKKYKKILRTKANHLFPRVLYYAIKNKHFKLAFKHFKLYTKTML